MATAALIQLYQLAQQRLIQLILSSVTVGRNTALLKQVNQELAKLSGKTLDWVQNQIPIDYQKGMDVANRAFEELPGRPATFPTEFATLNKKAIETLIKNTAADFDAALGFVGRKVRDDIRRAGLQATADKVLMGTTVDKMKKILAKQFADQGLSGIAYQRMGKTYYMQLDAYAELIARSTTREATNTGTLTQVQEFGHDLVKMSTHSGACPICTVLEGRVYSISGSDPVYPPLERAYSGEHANVHPNCGHVLMPYIPELMDDDELRRDRERSNRSFDIDKWTPQQQAQARKNIEAYEKGQKKKRERYTDRRQWKSWKAVLGDDAPTFSGFRRMKSSGSPRFEDLGRQYRAILQGPVAATQGGYKVDALGDVIIPKVPAQKVAASSGMPSTLSEATQWAKDHGMRAKYAKVSVETANRINVHITKLASRWNVLPHQIQESALEANVYASIVTQGNSQRVLHINQSMFANAASLERNLQADVISGWHPKGTASLEALISHEYGHLLHSKLGDVTYKKIGQTWNEFKVKPEGLSRYATKNDREFFAEAFSEYLHSPTPGPWAQKVGQIIERGVRKR